MAELTRLSLLWTLWLTNYLLLAQGPKLLRRELRHDRSTRGSRGVRLCFSENNDVTVTQGAAATADVGAADYVSAL